MNCFLSLKKVNKNQKSLKIKFKINIKHITYIAENQDLNKIKFFNKFF